ncbi:MAG: hypothetical protein JWM48_286 [Mycobacterium sp.]|nr:hypothetical protein [Mycobacterium sp.]
MVAPTDSSVNVSRERGVAGAACPVGAVCQGKQATVRVGGRCCHDHSTTRPRVVPADDGGPSVTTQPATGPGPAVDPARAAAPPRRPNGPRPRLPRSVRREQLLTAAREVFVVAGYHAASMDDIADRAGVSKPVLYQHFPSKRELYLALLERHITELVHGVEQALAVTTDNRLRVAGAVEAYFDFVGTDGAYRLVFESDLRGDAAVRELVESALTRCSEAIASTIAADTGVTPDEAMLLSVGLAGVAEMGARWWLGSGPEAGAAPPLTKARAVELLTGLAWRGIANSPKRPAPPAGDV